MPEVSAAYADITFPIVGVGSSAGGLEALTGLLHALPANPGVAFICIQHLDPTHASMLAQLLARATPLPVLEISDEQLVHINHIYVVPPNSEVAIEKGVLHLLARGTQKPALPIDQFLHSLAKDQGSRAIAVILSGSASDGAVGAKAVKAEGGIVFAQDESAKFDGMPSSAIASGAVDFVLPVDDIAQELVRIAHHAYVTGTSDAAALPREDLPKIFALLKAAHDVDFSHYKPTTVERRIRRRMAVHKFDGVNEYVEMLRSDPAEVERLYADILIRVTGFFRDPEVFSTLSSRILPEMLSGRASQAPVRVWVPGCATGEEAYSLAISLLDLTAALGAECPVQIFGTDVSDPAIEHARTGIYPENISAEVSPERLRRYFTRVDGGYRVSKAVRDCCVFARQNLTKDPPFSSLDLISCRNVMIYLGAPLQKKVMAIFHYALRPNGYLLLGSSETVGNYGDLFNIVDRKARIYQKRPATNRLQVAFEASTVRERSDRARVEDDTSTAANVFREADRVALARYSPAGVLINENMEILQFRGRTSPYLEPAPGMATFNILKMAREGLLAELRSAIYNSRKSEATIRREGIRVTAGGSTLIVSIEVIPFVSSAKERYQLVLFESGAAVEEPAPKKTRGKKSEKDDRQATRLKRELDATREYLQSIIEEQEAMNEELRSANEEIQSSNEELQSTNEEMETAKEELQSSNEELTTLNEELESRNEELAQANNDLVNLLASVDIPIVMLDNELRVRRFNPGAQRTLKLIPADVGRSISDLKTTLRVEDLETMIAEVIENLTVMEKEVQDGDGRWYSLRVRPYKTTENRIEGAVLVLVDIDGVKRTAS